MIHVFQFNSPTQHEGEHKRRDNRCVRIDENDHPPSPVHIFQNSKPGPEMEIALETMNIVANTIQASHARRAYELVRENREFLLSEWARIDPKLNQFKRAEMPHTELDEDLIDFDLFDLIARQTRERDKSRPLARAAHYDVATQQLAIELRSGVTMHIPARLIQGLAESSDEQRAAFYVTDSGAGLHWDALDVQLSVEGLAVGRFGTRAWMEQLNVEAAAA